MNTNVGITYRLVLGLLCLTFASCWATAQDEGVGDEGAPGFDPRFYRDGLVNRSCLSDAELRYYYEHQQEYRVAAKLLDKDRDGIVDGMDLPVDEFLARMAIILYDRMPFDYKCDIFGNPIECERPDPPVEKAM